MENNQLITGIRDYYGSLHHHKEQMAYAATVLYLAAASFVISQADEVLNWLAPSWLMVVLVGISGVVGIAFIVWQLRQRKNVADIVRDCTNEIIKNKELPKELYCKLKDRGSSNRLIDSEAITYFILAVWSIGVIYALYQAS